MDEMPEVDTAVETEKGAVGYVTETDEDAGQVKIDLSYASTWVWEKVENVEEVN